MGELEIQLGRCTAPAWHGQHVCAQSDRMEIVVDRHFFPGGGRGGEKDFLDTVVCSTRVTRAQSKPMLFSPQACGVPGDTGRWRV